jgi:glutamate 5-kinase
MIIHWPVEAPPRPAAVIMANALIADSSGRRAALHARCVVVKLGTAVLAGEEDGLALGRVRAVVESLVALRRAGREVLLVSSGAVRLGAERLGMGEGVGPRATCRACAAVGQGRLMAWYAEACERLGVAAAQVLLTAEDFVVPHRALGLRATLVELRAFGVLPVINENDAVSGAGREPDGPGGPGRTGLGDNDRLSALIATAVGADLLLMLTDVAGLYTADPRGRAEARLIPVVRRVTPRMERGAGGPRLGRGGMRSKLEAARIATGAGCAVVVADGRHPGVIERVCAGEEVGTLFPPRHAGSRRA